MSSLNLDPTSGFHFQEEEVEEDIEEENSGTSKVIYQQAVSKQAEIKSLKFIGVSHRIPTVKLEIPGKNIFEIRNQNFCYIQVIVFGLSYLPVAAVGS